MLKLSIKSKLQIMLLVASLGSILVVGYISWNKARSILSDRIFEQLTSVRASKTYQIESYLALLRNQIETLCENRMVVEAMQEFDQEYDFLSTTSISLDQSQQVQDYYEREFMPRLAKNIDGTPVYETYRPLAPESLYLQYQYIASNPNPVGKKDELISADDDSKYSQVHQRHHELFRNLIKRYGYYDLFLVDYETGDIVYSVYKETDYATSLYTGPYRSSNLAQIVEKVRDNPDRGAIQLIDFEFYRPSYNAPAAFIAGPIYDGDRRVGILAIQLPADEIDRVLTEDRSWKKNGLGDTGETYLVGKDLYLRSVSRQFLENSDSYLQNLSQRGVDRQTVNLIKSLETPILLQSIETEAVEEAIMGQTGTQIVEGFLGKKVLSSYAPLDIDGVDWGIVTEISLAEAYQPINSLESYLLLSTVVLILLMTLFATLAARSFTRPIDLMVKHLGNVDVDSMDGLHIDSQDELRELAEILNTIGKRVRTLTKALEKQNHERKELLSNILPATAVDRWERGEQISDRAQVTIIVIEVGGLEQAASRNVGEVTTGFNELVVGLDNRGEQIDVERLNCFGESYIAVCGLSRPRLDRIKRGVDFANDALNLVKEINLKYNLSLNLRIGIDTGQITAAIIGEQKFRYDIWGKPVNVATQLAQHTEVNTICVTKAVCDRLEDLFAFESDSAVTLSDKSTIPTWVLGKTGLKDLIGEVTSGLNFDED
ncbi:MAG: adenylate/guanylate cyclase domain-containing protein [Cyanobacteria bacterium P01_A01_bin.83]